VYLDDKLDWLSRLSDLENLKSVFFFTLTRFNPNKEALFRLMTMPFGQRLVSIELEFVNATHWEPTNEQKLQAQEMGTTTQQI
jgi:hypothetical protein